MSAAVPVVGEGRRRVLRRRIRRIVAATISYNVIEAVVALAAGSVAGSTALVGFGLDSVVEVLSAAAVAWQFAAPDPDSRERSALRLIAVSFFGVGVFVCLDAATTLAGARTPEHSPVGIGLAVASMLVMPGLSLLERRTGQELGSASAVADSRQTLVCAALSVAVLVGLVLNAALGWWWADPVAGLVIVWFAVREGLEAWRGETCVTPTSVLTGEQESGSHGCC